ncbi:asparaginase [Bacillus carboniphilus]|uniref:asparaginase n=1 Tax=Bacillus carboniphilus TaxID=86663 RepID=A0ABY9JZJ4_9BACI|nr:asparaginase [Bacillus carboniphilus]WLR43758.1 asparaginase [Bacillus carboniphilus]
MTKNILLIHTGGTISMEEDYVTGEVKPGTRNPLVNEMLSLENINIIVEELFHLPSPHIKTADMLKIKNAIEHSLNKIDGVVITHGTDTLEETAYFLDITTSIDIPIIVTGAMRSSNEIGSDGLYNLLSSIHVASSDDSKNRGVLVVMNDEIHTAKNVTKTHTSNLATFKSPQYGPIGYVNKRGVIYYHSPKVTPTLSVTKLNKKVPLLKAYAGIGNEILSYLLSMGIDGLIVEAFGQGNLPPTFAKGLIPLIEKNIPVVIVSRCFNGIVQDIYSYEGGGKYLKEKGVIFSNGLNGQKARLQLMIALETTNDMNELANIFSL